MELDAKGLKYLFALNQQYFKSCDTNFRIQHTSTVFSHYIITFGGYNFLSKPTENIMVDEISVLDIEADTFLDVEYSGTKPKGRAGHSACLLDGDKILIFGGVDDKQEIVKEVLLLSLSFEEALNPKVLYIHGAIIETTGAEELFTYGHTAHVYENLMYVFGGARKYQSDFCNELRRFDFNTRSWEICDGKNKPVKRMQHWSTIMGEELYIVGGFSSLNEKNGCLSDIWSCNLRTLKWSPKGSYLPSSARLSHARMGAFNNKLYIFGGYLDKEKPVCDWLYCWKNGNKIWKEMDFQQSRPSERSEHTMVVYENRLIIWGGRQKVYGGIIPQRNIFQIFIKDQEEEKEDEKKSWLGRIFGCNSN